MLLDRLVVALIEAERFLEKAKVLRTFQEGCVIMGGSPPHAVLASVRRASLDLSRALVELRKE